MGTDSPAGDGGGGAAGQDPNATQPGSDKPEGTPDGGASQDESPDLRTARSEAAKFRRLASERDSELKKLRDATASDAEKAIGAAKKEGYEEAVAKFRPMLFAADLRLAAMGVLADPDDAAKLLDLDAIETDSEGRPVEKSVKQALSDLVKSKPYLAAKPTPGSGNGFGGGADQGARGGSNGGGDANAWLRGLARTQTGR